jgi:hypothetical protein
MSPVLKLGANLGGQLKEFLLTDLEIAVDPLHEGATETSDCEGGVAAALTHTDDRFETQVSRSDETMTQPMDAATPRWFIPSTETVTDVSHLTGDATNRHLRFVGTECLLRNITLEDTVMTAILTTLRTG